MKRTFAEVFRRMSVHTTHTPFSLHLEIMNILGGLTHFRKRASASWKTFWLDEHNLDWLNLSNMMTSESGEIITAETAARCSTVFSCTRLLSDTIAQLPLKVLKTEADGDRSPAVSDPLYSVLLHSPNTWQTAFDYWKWNVKCLAFRGWYISKILRSSNNKVIGLIPLHPDSVKVDQAADGSLIFSGLGLVGKKKAMAIKDLPQKDAFFSFYETTDGITPASPISYNAETIGLAISATKHGSRFLKNDSTPPLVIQFPQKVDGESLKKTAENWMRKGTGKNTGMPKVVDWGAKVDKLSISNQDAQYLETRQFQKEEICGIFGIPTHMISDTKQAKGWSTVEQQGIEFVTYSLNPWLRRIEQSVRKCLIPKSEWKSKSAVFNVNALLRGDAKSRVQYYKDMRLIGGLNANEIRKLEDLNKREDESGDEYWKPLNYEIDPNNTSPINTESTDEE